MLSVCIPTVGRVETLPTLLFSIFQQSHRSSTVKEVIILDEAKVPVCESFMVNQAIDLLSIYGVDTKIVRRRRRSGIGAARVLFSEVAESDHIVMIDDDVVLDRECLSILSYRISEGAPWAVPTCVLVPAGLELDGYTSEEVSRYDTEVKRWTDKYPWFIPYFRYKEEVIKKDLECSGTQCIAITRDAVKKAEPALLRMGKLPREDTVLTKMSGPGVFDSNAKCFHFEHRTQLTRGEWGSRMFYRLHEAIVENPDGFISVMGYGK